MPLQHGSLLDLMVTEIRSAIDSGEIACDIGSVTQYVAGDPNDEILRNVVTHIVELMEIEDECTYLKEESSPSVQ